MHHENAAAPSLPEATLKEWGLWLLRRRGRLRVMGDSMVPTLAAGDLVLIDRGAYRAVAPEVGQIVVARHPFQRELLIIKRVAASVATDRYLLHSDNAGAGSDSRSFGAIARSDIIGRVTSRIPAAPGA